MNDTMKTDRELLELAAKAAKMNTREFASDSITRWHWREDGTHTAWNPLNDDGDALRLAVKLTLEVDICLSGVAVRTPHGDKILVDDRDEKCIYAATRRAITRAAAAIGEVMK